MNLSDLNKWESYKKVTQAQWRKPIAPTFYEKYVSDNGGSGFIKNTCTFFMRHKIEKT